MIPANNLFYLINKSKTAQTNIQQKGFPINARFYSNRNSPCVRMQCFAKWMNGNEKRYAPAGVCIDLDQLEKMIKRAEVRTSFLVLRLMRGQSLSRNQMVYVHGSWIYFEFPEQKEAKETAREQ
ncbi:hypothetical protein VTN00DRAFT_5331 [Thermoascus crustaceus]|uniref:uncharacterized protein n=1 Tax=Thermoascus crustaceus TaxID=5088 RepID=UPI003744A5F9